jgi:hypothetical protein
MVRLYIPLDETERYLDPVTKRVNIAAVNPDDLLDVRDAVLNVGKHSS